MRIKQLFLICIVCLHVLLHAEETHSLIGAIVMKKSISKSMSIAIFPTVPSSQEGRIYPFTGFNDIGRKIGSSIFQLMSLAELGLPRAGDEADKIMRNAVEITFPKVDYGYKGTMSGKDVCIIYKDPKRNCLKGFNSVTIERYDVRVLKGSYRSDEVSGAFYIVQPWRGDKDFITNMANRVSEAKENINQIAAMIAYAKKMANPGREMSPLNTNNHHSSNNKGGGGSNAKTAFLLKSPRSNYICFENLKNTNIFFFNKRREASTLQSKLDNIIMTDLAQCPNKDATHCSNEKRQIAQYIYPDLPTMPKELNSLKLKECTGYLTRGTQLQKVLSKKVLSKEEKIAKRIEEIKKDSSVYMMLSDKEKENQEITLAAITKQNASIISMNLPHTLKKNKDIAKKLIEKGVSLMLLDPVFQKDKTFLLLAVKHKPSEFQFIDESLKRDPDLILASVMTPTPYDDSKVIKNLKYLPNNLKKESKIFLDILRHNPKINTIFDHTLSYVDNSVKNDAAFVKEAVRLSASSLCFVDERFRKEKNLAEIALEKNGRVFGCLDHALKADKNLQDLAFKHGGGEEVMDFRLNSDEKYLQ